MLLSLSGKYLVERLQVIITYKNMNNYMVFQNYPQKLDKSKLKTCINY